jgi:ATP-dependent RNA helicase RhlE
VHRIGRTARAATTGTAITFINEKDQQKFARIESLIGKPVPKIDLPAELGIGPLYQPEIKRPSDKKHFGNRKGGGPKKFNKSK